MLNLLTKSASGSVDSCGPPPPGRFSSSILTTFGFPECLSTVGDWHIRDLYLRGLGTMRPLDSGKGPGNFRPAKGSKIPGNQERLEN